MNNQIAKIELRAGKGYFRWGCDICGETQEKDGMLSRVIYPDNEVGDVWEFDICRRCLEAGTEGAVARSLKRAEKLEESAQFQKEFIPNILRAVSDWKSDKDYDAISEAFEQAIINEINNAEKELQDDFPF